MADYENTFRLFKNEKKEQPNHADSRGDATVRCPRCDNVTTYWANAWTKIGKEGTKIAGQKWLSGSLKAKPPQDAYSAPANTAPTRPATDESSIPF